MGIGYVSSGATNSADVYATQAGDRVCIEVGALSIYMTAREAVELSERLLAKANEMLVREVAA